MSDPTTTPVWRCECGQEVTRKMGAWWCPTHRDLRVVHPDPSSAPSEARAQEADCPSSEKQLVHYPSVVARAELLNDALTERVRVLEEALRRIYGVPLSHNPRADASDMRRMARKALSGGGE